ncbi:MAG TPA: alpha/beta fold hydrolase [Verrucomicrobiae bacterium]
MKAKVTLSTLAALALTLFQISLHAAQDEAAGSPAGHWEGSIQLPTIPLGLRVDLDTNASGGWSGTIDIPVQGLRGFKLGSVDVRGRKVSFTMPGIPGDPRFDGSLDQTSNKISGNFNQGGQTFPFQLERKAKAASTGETPNRGVPGTGPVGHWQGSIKPTPIIELRLVLELTNAAGDALAGTLTSVDQGSAKFAVSSVTTNGQNLHLEAGAVGGVFDGTFSHDGSELAGAWKQAGNSLPLVFKRLATAPTFRRPQDPKPPYPYLEEEVVVENKAGGVKLGGTLTTPRGTGPYPAVILITGSGQQDRDEAIMGHRPFLVLADYLTRRGIAVLRCDDRGAGKSTGDFAKSTDTDFVEDTLAEIEFLRTRRAVDAKRIGLIGHSEGGIIAPRVAVKSSGVAFIVLLAGVGVPMEDLLVRQGQDIARVMGVGEDVIKKNTDTQREIFRLVREEKDPAVLKEKAGKFAREQISGLSEEQRKALGITDAMIEKQVEALATPWFRELLAYDPRPTLRKVTCPVLALTGEKDLQVAAKENLAAIREALLAGGNQRLKCEELVGLNHLFQTCTTGAVAEYSLIEETFSPKALKETADWILETVSSLNSRQ